MPELEPTVLPITVAASHLRSCAAERTELVDAIDDLVASQRLLSGALSRLADRVDTGRPDVLAATPGPMSRR